MLAHGLRPWEVNQLTWPQAQPLLGIKHADPAETTWPQVHQLYRDKRHEIYTKMAAAAGITTPRLVDLPIDQLETLWLTTTGHAAVDRVKLRARLTEDLAV